MFANCINFVLKWEGGKSNHPNDPGGRTNRGVTQKAYNQYAQKQGLPQKDVWELSLPETIQFYYDEYWLIEWEKLGPALAVCLLDTAINMGMSRALYFLSKCDGDYIKFLQLRLAKYKELVDKNPKLQVFYKGWMNRMTDLRRFAEAEDEARRGTF